MKTGMSYNKDMLRMVMLSMLSMKAVSCSLEVVVGVPFKGDSKVDQDWYKFFLLV